MTISKRTLFAAILAAAVLGPCATTPLAIQAFAQQAAPAAVRQLGTINAINGNAITLTTDAGTDVSVQVQEGARLLRVAPGQQDLKQATPIQLQELQAGDRILVRGKNSDDGKTLLAASVIAMKETDIAEKQKREMQDWQHRGAGGLVKAVDPAAGTVTISVMTATGAKPMTITVSKKTVIRRYSPDSIHFDDAKVGTLNEVKVGDQLRARGEKNADNTALSAEEIVSGTFRNIAGLISSVDTEKSTVTVQDLATKKPVTVQITSESQLHKMPPMMAQMLAMRLKGEAPEGSNPQGASGAQRPPMQGRPQGGPTQGAPGAANGNGRNGDFGSVLSRVALIRIGDLAKGDAVMIVSTEGSASTNATAITLLSGVEPILTASPNGSGAASLLTPWSLGGADAAAAAQ